MCFTSYKSVYILSMNLVKPNTCCPITKCQGCSTTAVLRLLTVDKLVVYMHISVFCALFYANNVDCISALLICTKLYLQCTDVSELDL